MNKSLRINCIAVIVDNDFNVTFRLTLPIKPNHVELFENPKWIVSYIRNNKIRYMLVYEDTDKEKVLTTMRAAQVIILTQKMKEMEMRKDQILAKLADKL